jgi:UDP-GlcNAc:undecaprenyl-phosphate GlcNAc-1-phosphate transferase
MNIEQSSSFLMIAFFSTIFSFSLVPLFQKIAQKYQLMDFPNQKHKSHATPVPYLGGLAVLVPLILTPILGYSFIFQDSEYVMRVLLFLLPACALSFLGLIDDILNLQPKTRLVFQLILSVLVTAALVFGGIGTTIADNLLLNLTVSVIWITGLTNALNFFDNIDGGAAGITIIISLSISLLAFLGNQTLVSLYALALAGSTLGFFLWNRNPARIYLGDSGALFMGYMLAMLLIQFEPLVDSKFSSMGVVLFLAAILIIDTSVAVISRITLRVSIFRGGRDHLSHRLVQVGITHSRAVIILYLIQFCFCLLAIYLANFEVAFSDELTFMGIVIMVGITLFFLRIKL